MLSSKTRLAAPEIKYMLEHAGARTFVSEQELLPLVETALEGLEGVLAISIDDGAGWIPLAELCRPELAGAVASVAERDLQRLMYTSGTTSRPKGVMISHANLAWKNAAHIGEFSVPGGDMGFVVGPLPRGRIGRNGYDASVCRRHHHRRPSPVRRPEDALCHGGAANHERLARPR